MLFSSHLVMPQSEIFANLFSKDRLYLGWSFGEISISDSDFELPACRKMSVLQSPKTCLKQNL